MIQGMSGFMDLTGEPDGPPEKIGVALADIITGLYGTIPFRRRWRTDRSPEGDSMSTWRFSIR